jgi:hypothetical protein
MMFGSVAVSLRRVLRCVRCAWRYQNEVMPSRASRMLRFTSGAWALVVIVAAALIHASVALGQTAPLELNALVQEGDRILEEAAALVPANEKLTREGLEVAAAGQTLRAEIQALEERCRRSTESVALRDAELAESRAARTALEETLRTVHTSNSAHAARVAELEALATDLGHALQAQTEATKRANASTENASADGDLDPPAGG